MSYWKDKSELSIQAANKLISESFHNVSVHCSYYSCVQFVFHIMYSHFGDSVKDIETQSKSGINNMGTHNWLRNYIYKSFKNKDAKAAKVFFNNMGHMVDRRVAADYRYGKIGQKEAIKVMEMASKTIRLLQDSYEV